MTTRVVLALLTVSVCLGCGTSKWTDTRRSATEQLLITDAMDRAVSRLDFRALAGKTIFVDDAPVKSLSDSEYLVSCLRQHMLASGCLIKQAREEADYIMEIRAGAVGTDRHDLLYGVPSVNIPTMVPVSGFGIPPQIPEIPFVKKTDQRAVAKIAVFAYNRETGRPVWQSGTVPSESDAKAVWVFGAGPFQGGSIYDGMSFAGDKLSIPLIDLDKGGDRDGAVSVADEAYFIEPEEAAETALAKKTEPPPKQPSPPPAAPSEPAPATAEPVVQASHTEKVEPDVEAPAVDEPAETPPTDPEPPAESAAAEDDGNAAAPSGITDPFQDGNDGTVENDQAASPPEALVYPAELFAPEGGPRGAL